MRNLLIYIATILCCLLFLKSVDAAVVWDGGSAVQTYKNAVKFGTNEQIKVDGSGDLKFVDSNSVERPVSKSEADFLLNRSFEKSHSGSPALSWTLSGATGTVSTSSPIDGNQLLSLSLSSTLSLSQEVTQTQFYPNVVSFSLWVKSSITDIQLCSTLATVEQECVDYDGSDQWKKLQVFVTAPSSGAMGLKLKTLSTTSGTILVDNGEFSSEPLKFGNRPDMVFLGSVAWVTTAGCVWSSTSATYGTFTTAACDDNARTIKGYYNSTNGDANNADGQTPQVKLSYIPQGLLKCRAIGSFAANIVNINQWRFSDGTNTSASSVTYNGQFPEVTGEIYYSEAQTNKTIQLQVSVRGGGVGDIYVHNEARDFEISCYSIPDKINDQILTANDVVSSETINWSFKSTAITDCGGADAIGKYNTYSKAASSNNFTLCGTAPATLPNNNDGFYMQALSFPNTGTCGGTGLGKVAICIGKGLKGYKLKGYQLANRSGQDIFVDGYANSSATNGYGMRSTYNEKTGILILDSARSLDGSETVREFQSSTTNTTYSNAYVHFAASKNPVISALDAVPRIDYSWENEFSARIANNGTATITTQNTDFIASVNRSSAGTVDIVFESGFFTQVPAVTAIGETGNTTNDVKIENLTTSGFTVRTYSSGAASYQDMNIDITVSRQGSDYRLPGGDVAAIIAQPTCYIREERTSALSSSSTTVHTRGLNATYGECSFASLSSSQVTLASGTYKIKGVGMSYKSDYTSLFLYNTSDSAYFSTKALGVYNNAADNAELPVTLEEYVTITSSKTFELRQYIQTGGSGGLCNYGVGAGSSPLTSVLCSQLVITKVK